jgi:hypothetical protein
MTYDGPTQSDYANVSALNREFLRLVRSQPELFRLSKEQQVRLPLLGRAQAERLATTPFLLFTISEDDEMAWTELCRGDPNTDLFRNGAAHNAGVRNLLGTTISFLWQLAQQNPYAIRLISGAGTAWCELVTGMTCFELVTLARQRGDLLALRQAGSADIWGKLLHDGVRAEREVRKSAHIAVLQTLLTCFPVTDADWPLAARKTRSPQLRVADEFSGRRCR